MDKQQEQYMRYSGAIALLCDCSSKISDPDIFSSIAQAVDEWCDGTDGRWGYVIEDHKITLVGLWARRTE